LRRVLFTLISGYYDSAFNISNYFQNIDKKIIFENLTLNCIKIQFQQETKLIIEGTYSKIKSLDMINNEFAKNEKSIFGGWRLLEYYLNKFEPSPKEEEEEGEDISMDNEIKEYRDYKYHLIVLEKIYATDRRIEPPIWIIKKLYRYHPSGLLTIFIKNNELRNGYKLVFEYIKWKVKKDNTKLFKLFYPNVIIPDLLIDNLLDLIVKKENIGEFDLKKFYELKSKFYELKPK
jgi:hypothetical protein